jgi:hypothetical protein
MIILIGYFRLKMQLLFKKQCYATIFYKLAVIWALTPTFRRMFWTNVLDEFFRRIFSTNFFDEFFRRIFSTNFFGEFFRRIFSTNFFDENILKIKTSVPV